MVRLKLQITAMQATNEDELIQKSGININFLKAESSEAITGILMRWAFITTLYTTGSLGIPGFK